MISLKKKWKKQNTYSYKKRKVFDDNNKIVFIIVILYQKIEKWNIKGDRVSFHKLFTNRSPSYSVPPHSFFTGSVKELKMDERRSVFIQKKLFFIISISAFFKFLLQRTERLSVCIRLSINAGIFNMRCCNFDFFFYYNPNMYIKRSIKFFIGFISQFHFHIFLPY